PHVVNDQLSADATRMDITLEGPLVTATGAVKSVLQPVPSGRKDVKRPSMLKADQSVNVTADAPHYDGTISTATYSSAALLWQDDTSIKGAEISIEDKTGNMTAGGTVTTSTMLEQTGKDKKTERVRSIGTGKDFIYEEGLRRAKYLRDAHMSGP